MRIWLIVVIAVVLGGTAGLGMGWREFRGVRVYFEPFSSTSATIPIAREDEQVPRLVVDGGAKFDFNTISHGASSEHTFVVRNEGARALELTFDRVSCGMCVEIDESYRQASVPPGGSVELLVRFAAKKPGGTFNESAYFNTNDPVLPKLRLDLTGTVTEAVRFFPAESAMGTVSASEGAVTSLKLLGYRPAKFELLGQKFSHPATSEFFEVTTTPMTDDEVAAADKLATAGMKVDLKIKPGLPLGALNQTISFQVRCEGEHNLDLPVTGEVVGDITVVGSNFSSNLGLLNLGVFPREAPTRATLHLLVKGPYRDSVKLSVGAVDPSSHLRVGLGEGIPVGDGKAIKYALNIEIVKDAPAINRSGTALGKMATIVVDTTHPATKHVNLKVRFITE